MLYIVVAVASAVVGGVVTFLVSRRNKNSVAAISGVIDSVVRK